MVVVLDADVSSVLETPDSVNKALRALIKAMPAQAAVSAGVPSVSRAVALGAEVRSPGRRA